MTNFFTKLASAFTLLALVASFVPAAAFAEEVVPAPEEPAAAPITTQQIVEDAAPSFTPSAVGSVVTEEFVTVDGSYKGISVGFRTVDVTDATAVSVTLTRADGSTVTKTANQGVLDIINAPTGTHQLTTPFVIKEGSFTEAGDTTYWNPGSSATWDASTKPTSVTMTVTSASEGNLVATNSSFSEGSSWPAYETLLSSALVDTQAELVAAIANPNFDTIIVENSFSVSSMVTVNRAVTIDGAGKTISGNFVKTDNSNNSVLLITVPGVTISDLVVDGGGAANNLHGINAYQTSGVTLTDVTAKNANAGVIVNDSDVTVNNITTENNRWGGINVDKGTATLVVNGTSSHSDVAGKPAIWKDDNSMAGVTVSGSMSQYTESIQPVNATTGTLYFLSTVKNEAELTAALANSNIPTITLGDSFPVSSQVAVNRTVTIIGNGKTITASGALSGSVVLITGSNVSISDLTVDGSDKGVHGIQAYVTTGVNLTDVTVKDNGKSGLLVNGSTVTVTNLTTTGNGWNGVNVDQGSGVTAPATLTVNGTSAHDENDAIWVDDITLAGVSVVDTNSQYVTSERAWVDGTTNLTGRVYVLAPEEESNGGGGSGRSGGSRRVTTDTSGAVDGGQVLGAETYNFAVDLTIGSTGADVIALQQILIDAGLLMIPAPTGYFGEMTRAALAKWQAAHNITPAVGYFGPMTRAAIKASGTPAPTMTDEARAALIKDLLEKVKELQEKLDAMEKDAA